MKKDFNNEEQRQAAEDARTAALIQEQLDQEAAEIEKELTQNPELAGMEPDDSVKEKLRKRIEEYESRQAVSHLSPEDQEALRLGRKLQKEKNRKENRRIVRIMKRTAGIAAVVAIVAAVGITGVGGPARVMEVLQQSIGKRKLIQVESDENETLSSGVSQEEKAYQEVKDKLGIELVRLFCQNENMKYVDVEIDQQLRTANMIYEINGQNMSYIINCSQEDELWSADLDDNMIREYSYKLKVGSAVIQEYSIRNSSDHKYTARFEYKDVHYQLTGIMTQQLMENILDNLHFL